MLPVICEFQSFSIIWPLVLDVFYYGILGICSSKSLQSKATNIAILKCFSQRASCGE